MFLFCLFLFSQNLVSQEIYQWRGENRDGIYNETDLLKEWPEDGPELLWSIRELGKGYSSATVTDDAIFISGMKDSSDYLTKLSPNGEQIWQIKYGGSWYKSFPDTRGTPTCENGKIYLISGNGTLAKIDSEKGSIDWSFNAFEKYKGAYGEWGICESLLLVDDKVIYTPGGHETTMVAIHKDTGEEVWKTNSIPDTTGYVSPIVINRGEKKKIINVLAKNIVAVDSEEGKILWSKNYYDTNSENSKAVWKRSPEINANTPLYHEGKLYITSGYNHTGVMFELNEDGTDANQLWVDSVLDVHHGGVVLVDGFLYGSNWINNKLGEWCCINWDTGEKQYSEKWKTKGSIIYADGLLFCYEERTGFLALVKANPEKFDMISSFKIPMGTGPHWAHPVIKNGVLYVRHGDALMAYKIK